MNMSDRVERDGLVAYARVHAEELLRRARLAATYMDVQRLAEDILDGRSELGVEMHEAAKQLELRIGAGKLDEYLDFLAHKSVMLEDES